MSETQLVLRIKGGSSFARDVWDILAQAAEEIEELYQNRQIEGIPSEEAYSSEVEQDNYDNQLPEEYSPQNRTYNAERPTSDPTLYAFPSNKTYTTEVDRAAPNGTYYANRPASDLTFNAPRPNTTANRTYNVSRPTTDQTFDACPANRFGQTFNTSTPNRTYSAQNRTYNAGSQTPDQTFNQSAKSTSFNPHPALTSTMIRTDDQTPPFRNFSDTAFFSEMDESSFLQGPDAQCGRTFNVGPQNKTFDVDAVNQNNRTFDVDRAAVSQNNRTYNVRCPANDQTYNVCPKNRTYTQPNRTYDAGCPAPNQTYNANRTYTAGNNQTYGIQSNTFNLPPDGELCTEVGPAPDCQNPNQTYVQKCSNETKNPSTEALKADDSKLQNCCGCPIHSKRKGKHRGCSCKKR